MAPEGQAQWEGIPALRRSCFDEGARDLGDERHETEEDENHHREPTPVATGVIRRAYAHAATE
jgi:hypothetical protein